MEDMVEFLKEIPRIIDSKHVMKVALKIPLRTKFLDSLEAQYYDLTGIRKLS